MFYYQLLLIFTIVVGRLMSTCATFVSDEEFRVCKEEYSTLPGYNMVLSHGKPSHDRGSVLIKSSLNKRLELGDPMGSWTYKIEDVHVIEQHLVNGFWNLTWIFSKPGLKKFSVTAKFQYFGKQQTIKNCTFINVTDCVLKPKIMVSTSAGSYNISHKHTNVDMNSPGLANFTLFLSAIDPYFVCKDLYFAWEFGDGCNASGNHVQHHYNKTGLYFAVLKLYKVFKDDGRKIFRRNITFKVDVKEKHVPAAASNMVVDVSLVLAIFFACFAFVVCVAVYWFRKRLHRHTEVARFDFRDTGLQSSIDENCTLKLKQGCFSSRTCRRDSSERLLNFSHPNYSSYQRFGSQNLHEEL